MCFILDQKAVSGRQLQGMNLKVYFTSQVIVIMSIGREKIGHYDGFWCT